MEKLSKLGDLLKAIRTHGSKNTSESAIALSRAKLQHAGDKAMFKRKMKWAEDEVKKMADK